MSAPHPDPEQLALAALPTEPRDPAVEGHLQHCAGCRTHVDDLRRTVELARGDGFRELPGPPPRVWRAIVDELAVDDPSDPGEAAGTDPGGLPRLAPPPASPAAAPPRRRRWLGSAAAAAAGVVAGLAAGLGIGTGPDDDAPAPAPEPAPVVRLSPIGSADPGASGTAAMVDRDGDRRMVVRLVGVTDLAGGDYLEAWLLDDTGTRMLPLGALARHGEEFRGEFTVPAGLPAGEYPRVDVSAERFDGDPGHSTVSLLRGDLA